MANEIQRFDNSGAFGGETCDLVGNGATTASVSLQVNTSALGIAMATIWGPGEVSITDNFDGTYDIEFNNTYANTDLAQMTVANYSGFGGVEPTFSTIQNGSAPAPAAPAYLLPGTIAETSVQLSWEDVADETSYRIEKSPAGAATWTSAATPAADVRAATITGLSASTSYDFRVFAVNAVGDSTACTLSAVSTTAAGTISLAPMEAGDSGSFDSVSGSILATNAIYLGDGAGTSSGPLDGFVRFTGGPPQGSTITSAVLTLLPNNTYTNNTCNVTVQFENTDAAAQISSAADGRGRTKTTGTAWNALDNWAFPTTEDTPDLASDLQTVINRGSYAGTLQLFLTDNASSANAERRATGYSDGAASNNRNRLPRLVVTFTAGGGGGSTGAARRRRILLGR